LFLENVLGSGNPDSRAVAHAGVFDSAAKPDVSHHAATSVSANRLDENNGRRKR
jgi:hypothetical protein